MSPFNLYTPTSSRLTHSLTHSLSLSLSRNRQTGKILEDAKTVGEYNIKENDFLVLMVTKVGWSIRYDIFAYHRVAVLNHLLHSSSSAIHSYIHPSRGIRSTIDSQRPHLLLLPLLQHRPRLLLLLLLPLKHPRRPKKLPRRLLRRQKRKRRRKPLLLPLLLPPRHLLLLALVALPL